jgi:hypothetical protein
MKTNNNIKLARLVSGEEIVGDIIVEKNSILIQEAYSLVAPEPGKIAFIPFMAYAKNTGGFRIKNEFVMFVGEPIDDMAEQVRQMSSKIDLPPAKKIVT